MSNQQIQRHFDFEISQKINKTFNMFCVILLASLLLILCQTQPNLAPVNNSALPNAYFLAPYYAPIRVRGAGLMANDSVFSFSSNSLPRGLTIRNNVAGEGIISGNPTETGNFTLVLQLRNNKNQSYNANYNLTIRIFRFDLSNVTLYQYKAVKIPFKFYGKGMRIDESRLPRWVKIQNDTIVLEPYKSGAQVLDIYVIDDKNNILQEQFDLVALNNSIKVTYTTPIFIKNSLSLDTSTSIVQAQGGSTPYYKMRFINLPECFQQSNTLSDNGMVYLSLSNSTSGCFGQYDLTLQIIEKDGSVNHFIVKFVVSETVPSTPIPESPFVQKIGNFDDRRLNRSSDMSSNTTTKTNFASQPIVGIKTSTSISTIVSQTQTISFNLPTISLQIILKLQYRYTELERNLPCVSPEDPIYNNLKISQCESATVLCVYLTFIQTVDGDILRWERCTKDNVGRRLQPGDKISWKGKLIPRLNNSYLLIELDFADESLPDQFSTSRNGTQPDNVWPPTYTQSLLYYSMRRKTTPTT